MELKNLNVRRTGGNYNVLLTDDLILVDATAAAVKIFLPSASAKFRVCVKKIDASVNAVTVYPSAGGTIDGAASYAITTRYQTVEVVSDGSKQVFVASDGVVSDDPDADADDAGSAAEINARSAATTLTGAEVIGIIQTTSKRTVLGMASIVTPEHYGAVGDGVTDDTTAVQAALTSGARGVFAKNIYKVTTTLQLATEQILFGLPRGIKTEDSPYTNAPRIIYRGAANTVAIKNAAGTEDNGVQDLGIDMNDNGSTALQFSASNYNVARRVQFYGTMRFGVLANDTYVCDFDTLSFEGSSVRTANVFLGVSNGTTIRKVTTSGYPNTVGECLYGVALSNSGNANSVRDCVLQGNTIGIAGSAAGYTELSNNYYENNVCMLRLGNIASSSGTYHVTGGTYGIPTAGHTQYAKRGPMVILACSNATFPGPAIATTAANAAATGPWPFVLDSCTRLSITNPQHTGGATATYGRDLIYRRVAGSNTGISMVCHYNSGTNYNAQELILKNSGEFASQCAGIRIASDESIAAVAYQPAIIFADMDALLLTDLPTGASLVI